MFHLTAAHTFGVPIGRNVVLIEAYDKKPESRSILSMGIAKWSLGVELEPIRSLRVGGRYVGFPEPESVAETDRDAEYIYGSSLEGEVSYVVIHRSDFMRDFYERIELSVGATIGYHMLTIATRLMSPYSSTYYVDTTATRNVFVPGIRIGGDYYLSRLLSLTLDMHASSIPSVGVPELILPSKGGTGYVLKKMHEHTADLSMTRWGLGIRAHF